MNGGAGLSDYTPVNEVVTWLAIGVDTRNTNLAELAVSEHLCHNHNVKNSHQVDQPCVLDYDLATTGTLVLGMIGGMVMSNSSNPNDPYGCTGKNSMALPVVITEQSCVEYLDLLSSSVVGDSTGVLSPNLLVQKDQLITDASNVSGSKVLVAGNYEPDQGHDDSIGCATGIDGKCNVQRDHSGVNAHKKGIGMLVSQEHSTQNANGAWAGATGAAMQEILMSALFGGTKGTEPGDLAEVANCAVCQSIDGDELNGEVDATAVEHYEGVVLNEDGVIVKLITDEQKVVSLAPKKTADDIDLVADATPIVYMYTKHLHIDLVYNGCLATQIGSHVVNTGQAASDHDKVIGIAIHCKLGNAVADISKSDDESVVVGDDIARNAKSTADVVAVKGQEEGDKLAGLTVVDTIIVPKDGVCDDCVLELMTGNSAVDLSSDLSLLEDCGGVETGAANFGGSCVEPRKIGDNEKRMTVVDGITIHVQVNVASLPSNNSRIIISIGVQPKEVSEQQRQIDVDGNAFLCLHSQSGSLYNALHIHDLNVVQGNYTILAIANGKLSDSKCEHCTGLPLPSSQGGDNPCVPVVGKDMKDIGSADCDVRTDHTLKNLLSKLCHDCCVAVAIGTLVDGKAMVGILPDSQPLKSMSILSGAFVEIKSAVMTDGIEAGLVVAKDGDIVIPQAVAFVGSLVGVVMSIAKVAINGIIAMSLSIAVIGILIEFQFGKFGQIEQFGQMKFGMGDEWYDGVNNVVGNGGNVGVAEQSLQIGVFAAVAAAVTTVSSVVGSIVACMLK